MSKAARSKTQGDKKLFFISLAVFVVTCVVVVALMSRTVSTGSAPSANDMPPTLAVLLTSIPAALEGGDGLYGQLGELAALVEACGDYSDERQTQMALHLLWLRDPEQIPRDLLVAMGGDAVGRLLLGMSTFTSQEWQTRERPPDSCLVPIGQRLDTLLLAVGQEASGVFQP